MKNTIFSLAALTLITAAFSSCKKDPTFKDQLVGTWQSVEVLQGETDLSQSTTFDLQLQSSNEFDLDITSIIPLAGKVIQSYNGDWAADNAKQDVTLTYNGTGDTKTWEVTSLTESTLSAELVQDNVRYKVKFEKQ